MSSAKDERDITSPLALTRRTRHKLRILTFLALFAAGFSAFLLTLGVFATELRPVHSAKATAVLKSAAAEVARSLDYGIPLQEMHGLEVYFSTLSNTHPELLSVHLEVQTESADGVQNKMVAQSHKADSKLGEGFRAKLAAVPGVLLSFIGRSQTPQPLREPVVLMDGTTPAVLVGTIDDAYLNSQLQNIFFDTLVILVAALLVAFEVVVVQATARTILPIEILEKAVIARAQGDLKAYPQASNQARATQLVRALNQRHKKLYEHARYVAHRLGKKAGSVSASAALDRLNALIAERKLGERKSERVLSVRDARIPLFIFCFAEELQKSFLPLFVAENYQPSDMFSKDIMVGLPISVFMFVIAALTPFAGSLVEKYGTRKMFLAGLVPAILGYVICSLAWNANSIVFGRGITALGYAVITISSQSYIAFVASGSERARAMAAFVGVLMTATMCGTAIGAIIADWVDYKTVFVVSAALATFAGILSWTMMDDVRDEAHNPHPVSASGASQRLLSNPRFLLLVILCAIPAKIILTGILYLFVPIYLASLEVSQSEIGRIMMLYSLIIIPVSPLASGLADQTNRNTAFVVGATIVSGVVLFGLYQNTSVMGVLLVVGALGLAHSFLKSPLIVAAMEAAEQTQGVSRTRAMSILRTSERIGSVIGPTLVAALLARFSFQITAVSIGSLVVVAGLVMCVVMLTTGSNRTRKLA